MRSICNHVLQHDEFCRKIVNFHGIVHLPTPFLTSSQQLLSHLSIGWQDRQLHHMEVWQDKLMTSEDKG